MVAEFISLICLGVCPGVNGYGYFCLIKLSSLFQQDMVTVTELEIGREYFPKVLSWQR